MFQKTGLNSDRNKHKVLLTTLSVIFEKDYFLNFNIKNDFRLNVSKINIKNLNNINSLKFLTEFSLNTLLDISTYELIGINNCEYFLSNEYNNLVNVYNFYSFYNNENLEFFIINNNTIASIGKTYDNAIWLEREQVEFFGVIFKNLDNRNLFLEYNQTNFVLKKLYDVNNGYNYKLGFYDHVIESYTNYSNI